MTRRPRPEFFASAWPVLVLLLLTFVFFHKLAFSGLILARGDTFNYFYPYWAARNAALVQGHLPLWSPDLFMGVPLLANPQLGTFYPPNWPLTSFSPPDGIRVSILLHVFWALLGTYALARRFRLGAVPALAAAAVFGFGGYTGAHVEQINQLQGLAWLPWLFLLFELSLAHPRRWLLPLAGGLALQFLSGHTQTVFISGVGLGVYVLSAEFRVLSAESKTFLFRIIRVQSLITLVLAALLALPLIAPQLVPTLELTQVSNRSGGLSFNEATSFSFNPLVAGRGLLPSYDAQLFGEYITYTGIIGLGLGLLGAVISPGFRYRWGVIALVGLLLAFGEFNPLYALLAQVPGFSLFRVPARWLALFTLGMAMLAGSGLQALLRHDFRLKLWHDALVIAPVVLLATSTLLTPQADVTGPAVPSLPTWVGWGAALAALLFALKVIRLRPVVIVALLAELLFASAVLPFNTLTPPETYTGQRFSISQLRAYPQTPPGRLLSISGLLFDPGDKAALEQRYRQFNMSDLAVRLGLVATKRKEIVAPNLPLVWGIPSVDGFDGGLLPTRYYTAFSSLLLPPDSDPLTDGRLFETLAQPDCRGACIPDQRWLNLTNTRYLITDKVYDLWHEGVAYDTQLPVHLAAGDSFSLSNPTRFEANAVNILYTGDAPPAVMADSVTLSSQEAGTALEQFRLLQMVASGPSVSSTVEISAETEVTVYAVTLVDTRTGDFAQLTLPRWHRLLSSDIKLYENQSVLPRAFVVHDVLTVPDTEAGTMQALDLMRDDTFDPAASGVIHTSPSNPLSNLERENQAQQNVTTITHYSSERVEISVESEGGGYLILTDAYYPGWQAAVNGEAMPVHRANVMFRAVPVPAGSSAVVFSYKPGWLPGVLIVGAAGWGLWLIATVWITRTGLRYSRLFPRVQDR